MSVTVSHFWLKYLRNNSSHGSGAMEQQVEAMLQEMRALRQVLLQQDQRNVEEIPLLQDMFMTSKTNNWEMVNHLKNVQLQRRPGVG